MTTDAARAEWPMTSYAQNWTMFRDASNENALTAQHILNQAQWPQTGNLSVLDVGCGDGRLIHDIVMRSRNIKNVTLIDPDTYFMDEAARRLAETGIVNTTRLLGRAEDFFTTDLNGVDVILAAHVVYFLEEGCIETLIQSLPRQCPLYVVLDAPESIFSRLWKKTAPKYLSRAAHAHTVMQKLSVGDMDVTCSMIRSFLPNPIAFQEESVRTSLLSLLCYRDISTMTAPEQEWVIEEIKRHVVNGHIHCDSACYEIVRH